MLERILEVTGGCGYDFRTTANPNDPLKHLFPEWVDYYRLKWSIAHVLQPASILEIGVRFGYSAAAFLDASPQARYLGIDLDSDTFGGTKGAIHWAEEIMRPFHAEFLVGDTQRMQRLPGGTYDLIHVDGQQDGDGSWHDLQLAIKQGRWVLVDGFFWTEQNFLSASHFLYRYRDVIRLYGVIPGYAGELLIQVSPEYLESVCISEGEVTSVKIRESYTDNYYLQDCGGFEHYKNCGGKFLEDERLQVVAAIATGSDPHRVLDLGCGRGELAYFFAEQGAHVTAVDYSEAAIQLCEKTFEGQEELRRRVQLLNSDVCKMPLTGVFDFVTASDVVEHLSPDELETLYRRVSQHLAQDGLFVVHTYPNLWYFQYDYERKRRAAQSAGAYLPPEPRTRYELAMHINEQSPRVLKRSLLRHFRDVFLWFGEPGRPTRSMHQKMSHAELAGCRDLYAIASQSPIEREKIKEFFVSNPLPPDELDRIKLQICEVPETVPAGSMFTITVRVINSSPYSLSSYPPNPVRLSYHWLSEDKGETLLFDGERSAIAPPLCPGGQRRFQVRVRAPIKPGKLVLRITVVQEAVRWFDFPPINLAEDVQVVVVSV